jgi:hypothetical protein
MILDNRKWLLLCVILLEKKNKYFKFFQVRKLAGLRNSGKFVLREESFIEERV